MPSVFALLKSTHIRPAALLLSISKSNRFYFKLDQCSFDRLNSLFQKPDCNPYSRLYLERYEYTESQIGLSKFLDRINQNWTIIRKSVNVEIYPFLCGKLLKILHGILHAKQSEMQTFETIRIFLQFLFALPLNNSICLSVCFFRMLSDNPVEIIGSDAFTVPGNDLLVQVFDVL